MFVWLHRWLLCASFASIGVGALLVFAPTTPLFAAYNQSAANAFFMGHLAGDALEHHAWALGLTGAGTIGWAIMMSFVVAVPFKRKEPWAWWALAVSVPVWLALDVWLSWRAHVYAECVFACAAAVAMLPPIILTRSSFTRPRDTQRA